MVQACATCHLERKDHRGSGHSFMSPSLDYVPVSCPWCDKAVFRVELELHARGVGHSRLAPVKRSKPTPPHRDKWQASFLDAVEKPS